MGAKVDAEGGGAEEGALAVLLLVKEGSDGADDSFVVRGGAAERVRERALEAAVGADEEAEAVREAGLVVVADVVFVFANAGLFVRLAAFAFCCCSASSSLSRCRFFFISSHSRASEEACWPSTTAEKPCLTESIWAPYISMNSRKETSRAACGQLERRVHICDDAPSMMRLRWSRNRWVLRAFSRSVFSRKVAICSSGIETPCALRGALTKEVCGSTSSSLDSMRAFGRFALFFVDCDADLAVLDVLLGFAR